MMKRTLDEVLNSVMEKMPEGIQQGAASMKTCLREALQSSLSKLDLVTREDFDTQKALLLRLQEKIQDLEKTLQSRD